MVGLLGVDVVTADPVTYEIPLETLIERDPEVIILGVNAFYGPTLEIIAKRNGWSASVGRSSLKSARPART